MKKCLIILLIWLCSFAVFAEGSAILEVTLNVESKGPYYAFNTVKEKAFTGTPSSVEGPVSLDSDLIDLPDNQVLYAIATTNSPSAVCATLSWHDFTAPGVETSIPLTISSKTCYINGSTKGLDFNLESATSNSKSDTVSITLTEPKEVEGASNEARAVNFLLKLEANKDAFGKATYVEDGYSTILTLTVVSP